MTVVLIEETNKFCYNAVLGRLWLLLVDLLRSVNRNSMVCKTSENHPLFAGLSIKSASGKLLPTFIFCHSERLINCRDVMFLLVSSSLFRCWAVFYFHPYFCCSTVSNEQNIKFMTVLCHISTPVLFVTP